MSLWTATITKESVLFGEEFSNVYSIEAIDAFNALEVATDIMQLETNVSYNTILFTKVHVIDETDHERTRTSLFATPGALNATGLGGPLPLFCTVRVNFANLSGRPEMKYLRLGANEANLADGRWSTELTIFVQDEYATPLQANTQFVGPSGEAHVASSVSVPVQNRQLGWKRRGRPGYKRGWVPA